ncbi:unnamed protein product [Lactuca saligna]|uniref:Uncharacterized protein n=1 Tax=Lactuca saligna TaxID=75948 RepID=A0AA36EMK8_LACSI|nr:unnamed protein product [Lactuca saligna]
MLSPIPFCKMYPSNGHPSLSPAAINYSSYYQMATNIHGQPLSYSYLGYGQWNSLNQFQGAPVSPWLDHAGLYSSGGQPPSLGVVSQTFVSQLSGSNLTYSTYAQAVSVGAVGQTILSQAYSNNQIYSYLQPPSTGAPMETFVSQFSGSDQRFSSHGQTPSSGAVSPTVVSQAASNYQPYTYVQPPVGDVRQTFVSQLTGSDQTYSTYGQPPSVGAVCQTVGSQASGNDEIYSNNVQPSSIEAVNQTFVSQSSGSEKIESNGQPPKRNSVGRRAKKDYKDVSEKLSSDLFGKNSETHQSGSSIVKNVQSTGKEVSSTGDEALAMWLGLNANGHANDETDLFSFPNLEEYKAIARRYRHRRLKEE